MSLKRTLIHCVRRVRLRLSRPLERLPDVPDLFRTYRSFLNHPDLRRMPGGWLYKGEFYPDYLTVGGAGHAVFQEALRYCSGEGVDIGAGLWPLPGATPVDATRGPGLGNRVQDVVDGSLDFVFSSHCLEHIEHWNDALEEWVGKLKHGGRIFLYLPHPRCAIWLSGSPFVGDGHKWTPTPEIIKQSLQALGCEIIHCDDGPDAMQSFYVCGRKSTPRSDNITS